MRTALLAGKPRVLWGWKKPTEPSRHAAMAPPTEPLPSIVSVPEEWRASVQDQGSIGDCTCQALRECMTNLVLRTQSLTQQPRQEILYSALATYYWARQLDGAAPTDDAGSTVETVFAIAATRGIPRIGAWPDDKPFSEKPDAAADADASQHRLLLPFYLPNIATMKASIRDGFVPEFGFDCPKDIFESKTQTTGDVQFHDDPAMYDGSGHAVTAVEADDNYGIGPYAGAFRCNFHWGIGAGDGGYFHVPYAYFTHGRAGDAHRMGLGSTP